jgi:hypothetical protein
VKVRTFRSLVTKIHHDLCSENLRRTFHRWLSAARASRHRRVTLQQKEAELKHSWLVAAWDKWRERYLREKLRPLVSAKAAGS